MQDQKFTLPYPPLQVRAGVLVVDGYGINLRCLYGKLHVEDGIADRRRRIVLDRAGSGLERLVLLGKAGSLTLEALAWLRAIGAALVHIGPDGAALAHSIPFGYEGQPIRRAQALATTNGLNVDLARDLIIQKLDGQRKNLVRLCINDLRIFDALREALHHANTVEDVRLCEARAAVFYWNAWLNVPIRLRGRDLARMPARWARYDARASALTGAPRAATNPVNALLNYLYALLESEARLALLAAGLDPTLGVMHADAPYRDSFAFDVMEPVRPSVDAFVLDLLQEKTFTVRDFVELPNGTCRIRAPLTHELALTLPRWRLQVAPVAARLAQIFRAALRDANEALSLIGSAMPARAKRIAASPLDATPRKLTVARPLQKRYARTPRQPSLNFEPPPCARCGSPVQRERRRFCDACLPTARVEHELRSVDRARATLAAATAAGRDPRARPDVCARRAASVAEAHRRNREWKRESQTDDGRDLAWYERTIAPYLEALTLHTIARATGVTLTSASRWRTGKRIPHPRHWEALLALVGSNDA